ncbi:putative ATP-dependent RNA helicase DHR1 [Tulasnella sp. UAMH 9824]|nr:putative ATP-dependent RNA helicase DHR1 [Tulasnella sp. UAMH 9824]
MPPPSRPRYNAKARAHPHKKRKVSRESKKIQNEDSSLRPESTRSEPLETIGTPTKIREPKQPNENRTNAASPAPAAVVEPTLVDALHIPKTMAQKEQEKKERMMQEIIEASNSKWNRNRKKKLEAYITKKLKKEERARIFERLAKTQEEVDHLQLQSSSTLGSAKPMTHLQRLAIAEDQAVRRAIDTRGGRQKRRRGGPIPMPNEDLSSGSDSSSNSDISSEMEEDGSSWGGIADSDDDEMRDPIPETTPTPALIGPAPQVGSALRRNPDGTVVVPKIVPRRPKPVLGRKRKTLVEPADQPPSEDEDDEELVESDSDESDDASSETEDSAASTNDEDSSGESEGDSADSATTEEDRSDNSPSTGQKRKRHGGFKEWAQKQLDAAKGPPPVPTAAESVSNIPTEYYAHLPQHLREKAFEASHSRQGDSIGPLGQKFVLPDTPFAKQVLAEIASPEKAARKSVLVERSKEIDASRMLLPIISEEQVIVETVLLNPVTVICGETGSGKTTQVPQFLFEAGFGTPGSDNPGTIGITQPRRVAAMSMAARVAEELNLPANRVSYQIRYDATVSERTSIKFMTDGVLLRELSQDFLLTKYSVIIVDEAHERSMNTDILIGVLSRVIRLRDEMWREGKDGVKPLRLIIMSATLRVTDFTENTTLFSTPPPIISVEGRQHPVSVHFNRRTTHDYVNEAVKKASKIHARLPAGGILIFLTGQNEVHDVCRKLEKKYGKAVIEGKERLRKEAFGKTGLEGRLKDWIEGNDNGEVITARDGAVEVEELGIETANDTNLDDVKDNSPVEKDPEALDTDSEGSDSEEEVEIIADESDVPMHIVPLYSLLPKEKQMKVFERPPLGSRLVVVATNVAETSITIPGITYVVDAGRAKQRHCDTQTGIESFRVGWISKASAAQRSGRAGRTGPGHCYRLYSSAFYENHFDKFDEPEILRMPIEGVVLQMKAMHIDAVVNFPFPTPPDRQALQKAEQVLIYLSALEKAQVSSKSLVLPLQKPLARTGAQINDLGRAMALFPVSPRFSKILAIGKQQGCLPYVIAMVAAMSVGDPFLREEAIGIDETGEGALEHGRREEMAPEADLIQDPEQQAKEERKAKRRAFFRSQMLHSKLGGGKSDVFKILSVIGAYEFEGGGREFCDEHFAMEEIHKLRAQLSHIVQANFDGVDADFSPKMPPPTNTQLKALRQLITSGFIDRVAVRKDVADKALATGDKMRSCRNIAYRSMEIDEDVFIHPSSVIFHDTPPEWVVFQEVVRTSRVYVKGITVINPAWLPTLGPSLCTYSKPLGLPDSMKKLGADLKIVTPRFGPHGWPLPNIKL